MKCLCINLTEYIQNLYAENYKNTGGKKKDDVNNKYIHAMFMGWKTQIVKM